jgi:hypothetical protein
MQDEADWRDDAACADMGPAIFYAERLPGIVNRGVDARAVCARCPGGSSDRQRRRWRRLLRASAHADVGYIAGCGCALCRAVDAHFARVERAFGEGGGFAHGRAEAFWVGCRCRACSAAWKQRVG